jgi:hypothetical protein
MVYSKVVAKDRGSLEEYLNKQVPAIPNARRLLTCRCMYSELVTVNAFYRGLGLMMTNLRPSSFNIGRSWLSGKLTAFRVENEEPVHYAKSWPYYDNRVDALRVGHSVVAVILIYLRLTEGLQFHRVVSQVREINAQSDSSFSSSELALKLIAALTDSQLVHAVLKVEIEKGNQHLSSEESVQEVIKFFRFWAFTGNYPNRVQLHALYDDSNSSEQWVDEQMRSGYGSQVAEPSRVIEEVPEAKGTRKPPQKATKQIAKEPKAAAQHGRGRGKNGKK